MTCGNLFLQISTQYRYSVWGRLCFIWNVYFQFYHWKNNNLVFCSFFIWQKIDLFSLFTFILFALFCIPGTCVFYNWKKIHSWSNNQLSCGILIKIFRMQAGDYEQIIMIDLIMSPPSSLFTTKLFIEVQTFSGKSYGRLFY